MIKRIIKNFLKNTKTKKGFLFIVFFIVFSFYLVVPTPTHALAPLAVAALVPIIGGAVSIIAKLGTGLLIVFLLTNFAGAILAWGLSFLASNIDPLRLTFSYTGFDNPIISAGWPILRDFSNIALVLGLVIIGLATALRINEYQAQKVLPKLIIIALLVNFSPVFCGIIIDASNILTNFFLKDITGIEDSGLLGFAKELTNFGRNNLNVFGLTESVDLFKSNFWIMLFIYLFMVITAGSAFLIFGIIFMARDVALWLLVMFSPLAFVCWILPATKSVWEMWLKQFLSWSFIGVAFSFFLYIANQLAVTIIAQSPSPGVGKSFWGFRNFNMATISEFNSYFAIIVICMYLGLYLGTKTSAAGVGAITSWVQKYTSPSAVGKFTERAGSAVGKTAKAVAMEAGITRGLTPGATEQAKQERLGKIAKNVNAIADDKRIVHMAKQKPITTDGKDYQAMAVKRLMEENKFDDIPIADRETALGRGIKNGRLTKKDVLPYSPEYADKFKDSAGSNLTIKDTINNMDGKDIKKINKSSWENTEVLDAAIKNPNILKAMGKLDKNTKITLKANTRSHMLSVWPTATPTERMEYSKIWRKINRDPSWA